CTRGEYSNSIDYW
nr:immunoglobulin heavy chain junction region [Macaca mulatta]MOX59478.1 immunoglobulin heavy chain junction region [Macaca mulatta]MOX60369.1 immunoglobulin heavy chain junction region [Macaca mulatta]MOX60580.1 immunoglobulin heavy chain junction region [Macaca mulatta]MOX60650.1 immunoglobulin heavy chain junction region [Macaca mulatta]